MVPFSLEAFTPAPIAPEQAPATRRHQGIPGLEILPSGRMFAVWYGGSLAGEGPGNYVVLSTSADGGRSWREIQVVAPPPDRADRERAYDSVLWLDPNERLWWLWSQSGTPEIWKIYDGRAGVWAAVCDRPDTDAPAWSEPRRIAEGVMMNKPTVLADGAWAFPTALWKFGAYVPDEAFAGQACANLLLTRDAGKTFDLVVGPDVPQRQFDEHMLVEKRDGTWWVLVRTDYGIGESCSADRGRTWSAPADARLGGPASRFAIRRLASGKLLLVNHQSPRPLPGETGVGSPREKLTAWLSDDDGASWYGRLMLDERQGVSYPDVVEGPDGWLYAIYDHGRHAHGQILLARFTEADVAAGDWITPGGYTRLVVNAFPGLPPA